MASPKKATQPNDPKNRKAVESEKDREKEFAAFVAEVKSTKTRAMVFAKVFFFFLTCWVYAIVNISLFPNNARPFIYAVRGFFREKFGLFCGWL